MPEKERQIAMYEYQPGEDSDILGLMSIGSEDHQKDFVLTLTPIEQVMQVWLIEQEGFESLHNQLGDGAVIRLPEADPKKIQIYQLDLGQLELEEIKAGVGEAGRLLLNIYGWDTISRRSSGPLRLREQQLVDLFLPPSGSADLSRMIEVKSELTPVEFAIATKNPNDHDQWVLGFLHPQVHIAADERGSPEGLFYYQSKAVVHELLQRLYFQLTKRVDQVGLQEVASETVDEAIDKHWVIFGEKSIALSRRDRQTLEQLYRVQVQLAARMAVTHKERDHYMDLLNSFGIYHDGRWTRRRFRPKVITLDFQKWQEVLDAIQERDTIQVDEFSDHPLVEVRGLGKKRLSIEQMSRLPTEQLFFHTGEYLKKTVAMYRRSRFGGIGGIGKRHMDNIYQRIIHLLQATELLRYRYSNVFSQAELQDMNIDPVQKSWLDFCKYQGWLCYKFFLDEEQGSYIRLARKRFRKWRYRVISLRTAQKDKINPLELAYILADDNADGHYDAKAIWDEFEEKLYKAKFGKSFGVKHVLNVNIIALADVLLKKLMLFPFAVEYERVSQVRDRSAMKAWSDNLCAFLQDIIQEDNKLR